jgi:hypothetical protein
MPRSNSKNSPHESILDRNPRIWMQHDANPWYSSISWDRRWFRAIFMLNRSFTTLNVAMPPGFSRGIVRTQRIEERLWVKDGSIYDRWISVKSLAEVEIWSLSNEAIFGLILLQLWVMIGRFSQRTTSMSNPETNLPLNSMNMFHFLKLFTALVVIFGFVHCSAEILGYGCNIIQILDIINILI